METIYSLSKSTSSSTSACSDDDGVGELRRGPWTGEEDSLLVHYISCHGEGRWNLLAKCSGLKRTGKSCRLRWLNYLKPDVKRGNLSPEEQLLILQLHSKWGNRWSKIAQYLPGRTDNEIKNYWRTRVQKQARHLKIDPNSTEFQELIRTVWMPRLLQKVQLGTNPSQDPSATQVLPHGFNNNHHQFLNQTMENMSSASSRNSPSSMSSSESPNMSSLPQISEFYENPNYPIVNNSYCHSQTECYNADGITFDIETWNSGAHVTTPGGSIGPTNYTTGQNNWLIDEMGHYLWSNLDEFWQVRQSQERYN